MKEFKMNGVNLPTLSSMQKQKRNSSFIFSVKQINLFIFILIMNIIN